MMHIYEKFKSALGLFRCPICKSDFELIGSKSMVCKNHHCYDLSAKGYVNFLPQAQNKKYTKALFESRQAIFQSGLYKGVQQTIAALVSAFYAKNKNPKILDAGCGEGYYSRALAAELKGLPQILAFDNVKEAVKMAAHKQDNICWMVADLTCIPLKDACIDIILDILTPSNYREFTRLLGYNGIIIKIVPRENYLIELRSQLSLQQQKKAYSNEPIRDYFKEHLTLVEQIPITYTKTLSPEQKKSLYQMTPMTFGIDPAAFHLISLDSITIDLDVLVGKVKTPGF